MIVEYPSFFNMGTKNAIITYIKMYYTLQFFGLTRQLATSSISSKKKIANFSILGDVEFTEKAGEILERELRKHNIIPDCFVGPEVKVVPFIHHMAKRFHHNR